MKRGLIPRDYVLLQIGDILKWVEKNAPEDLQFWESVKHYVQNGKEEKENLPKA